MPATTTGAPFTLNVPSLSSDLADLFGTYLVPNMTAINTYAAHKGTAQTFSALQTFSAGLTVSSGTTTIPAGSASTPSITPTGDTNTGTFYPAADTIAWATGGSERIRINSSGNVGVGTAGPLGKFEVDGNIILKGAAGGNTWTNQRLLFGGDGTGYTCSIGSINNLGTINTPVMTLQDNGRVGIGTGSPSTGLHVSTSDGSITANNTGGTDSSLFLQTTGTLKWSITQAPLAGDRLYIRDAQTDDGVYIAQNTTSWTANSDSRLKDVQGTITDALAKVGQLTGVKFTWKRDADNPDAKVRVGLIAQDVQAVLPEAVDDESPDLITDEETGKVSGGLGVRYTELVPLLVNAINELTARVVALEAQVASA